MPRDQREWPRMRERPNGFLLAPGVREKVGRDLAGPLRPGRVDVGTVIARGAVADSSRESDLGMDQMRMRRDSIGQKFPETDPPSPLLGSELRDGRFGRRTSRREDR